jgi:hypothetical protein
MRIMIVSANEPVVARDRAPDRADDRGHHRDRERDLQRALRAAQHPGELVVAEVVGAEGVLARGRHRVVRRDVRVLVVPERAADEGEQHDGDQHEDADHGQFVLQEPTQDQLELGARLDGELALDGARGRRDAAGGLGVLYGKIMHGESSGPGPRRAGRR